jgi:regulator of replication initiation timing
MQYQREVGMKREVLERLEGLRTELRLLEKNEGSMTEVWKSKCKELVDICNKLKIENDSLRTKIGQIAINLTSNYNMGLQQEDQQPYRQASYDQ